MPIWIPTPKWKGQDVFIIGGGKSLEYFDWNLLKDERTIGCNDAYLHGSDICKICLFGDSKWFKLHRDRLAEYKGVIFTNVGRLYNIELDWVWSMKRMATGIHSDALGWNFNTGASAINLAVLLGASKIYLLGFDMHLTDGKNNWHENPLDKPNSDIFTNFNNGFKCVAKDMKAKFPDVKIVNVTDKSSLHLFPKKGVKEFWDERKRA